MTNLKKMARSLLQQVPGRGTHLREETRVNNVIQSSKKLHTVLTPPQQDGIDLNRLQVLYLRRLHGLTEAQAQAIAALVWGAM